MRYTNDFENDEFVDIYSSYEDISSNSKPLKKKRKKKSVLTKILIALCILLTLVIVAGMGLYWYAYSIVEKIEQVPLETQDPVELNIVTNDYADVKNIALLGIDTRQDNDSGRSDAIIILSIDKKHDKIKMISIARDSYVEIDGRGHDKLTHAYAFGKSTLAVKTLNKNYNLEISDYVMVNFHGFSRIIDYIGGVEIDVNKKEMDHLNSYVIPKLVKSGFKCDPIKRTGKQKLNGTQALCYARIRKIDGDIERGNRQKEVLSAMFQKVKVMDIQNLPTVVEMIFSHCTTSLGTDDIMDMGIWALTTSPELVNMSIPNDTVKGKGQTIRGVWYYVYDIEAAAKQMKEFILEE